MTRPDLIASLASAGLYRGAWTLDDAVYDPVSAAFVTQAWEAWVASLPVELRSMVQVGGGKSIAAPLWLSEVFDCDNLAVDFSVFLTRCMAVDAVKLKKPRGNFAGGRFNFFLNGNPATAHCRNWFMDYDGAVHVFDAGNCQLDGMTKAEIESIYAGETI